MLSAGCAAQYEDFQGEREVLLCEIQQACGENVRCDLIDTSFEKDRCERFRPGKANTCLEKLEQHLERVEAEPDVCMDGGWPDIQECDDAIEWRDSPRCAQPVAGRPLQHEGRWLLPEVTRGDAWAQHVLARPDVDRASTRAAAEYWLEVARVEHASVASFARVSLELMAVGAPPHLLEGCHRAALDEVRHARMALDLARALGDEAWDLGAIPGVPPRSVTLRQIALDALLEGCIGEGGAAASAHLAAEWTEGPLADALRRIAADETRHATLAWATLRWTLQRDPSLAEPLREALVRARDDRRHRLASASEGRPGLASLGVVSAAEALCVELDVLERIVEPVLARLIGEVRGSTTVA